MPASACQVPGGPASCNTQIDWVNFVQVRETQYVAGPGGSETVPEAALGPVYTHVKAKLSGRICDPGYRPRDGDAAFLDPGTPVYQLTGYPPGQRLAARFNGQLVVYSAMGGPPTP
ncbi:MAG: hypothetical protein ABI838_01485 [Chloroflexota bacterium]